MGNKYSKPAPVFITLRVSNFQLERNENKILIYLLLPSTNF